ncbi:hypothetical protein [Alicyclobacillus sp. SO9]|uniref:hypothetical protein n=1 Tax=Alicyclobacillus sp. SO9 TaxID=2665646 RepID=UPI0018E86416|nr:hypothetical protein [Alicyclobacillus sp. SO9]QQE80911.1 hypothetical protein GI364_11300 [Alicyclobacillus sp. SO9]
MLDGQQELCNRRVDETETRRAVRLVFELYRKRKRLLEMQMIPHVEPAPAKRGYENAMDPKYIHAQGVNPSAPIDRPMDPDDRRREYCHSIEHSVRCLPEYQAEIMRRCYMVKEAPGTGGLLPSDPSVHQELRNEGWLVGITYFYTQKEEAIMQLAEAWRCIRFVKDEI